MEDLVKKSGINFELYGDKLKYNKEEYAPAVDWEKTFEAGSYAYHKQETYLPVLYFGARYMEKSSDEDIFVKNDFMADLTVINPGKVGDEIIITVGHYHGKVPGTDIAYPEVYEAVTDGFEYLLQTEIDENGEVSVIWVLAEAGDKIIMPPGYGHVSMNVGSTPAVEVDIQKRDNPNNSDYTVMKEKVGGAIFRTAEGLIENPNYKIKSLRIVKPKEAPEWGLTKAVPLYTSFVNNPEKFEWLLKPQDYDFELDKFFEDIEL